MMLAIVLACLTIATGAEAGSTWFGPQLAFPVPARDIGNDQLGIDAGVVLNHTESSYISVGLDFVYHYWPASPDYKAAFDRYLRNTRYQVIDGSTWALSAFQGTAHVKLVAPLSERFSPWVQAGAGMYRLNRNLAGPNWDGSPVIVRGLGLGDILLEPGWCGSVGVDFQTRSDLTLGLDATYHHLWSDDSKELRDFSALTVGTHILFGW
jgi:opacity protein-like surface antigen